MALVSPASGPLNGVTVLDLSTVGPAARCTRLLSDYGALVVKVGPVPTADAAPIQPQYFAYSGHRGMRRALVDLKDEEGREAFLSLAGAADVVVESFRPGVVDRLGVGYSAVSARNPGVIYCSTSGYGQDGPASQWAGHDIDYLAVGGFLAMSTPGVGGAPPIPGATVADAAAGGMQAALAVTAALAGRATTGRGAYLDVSVAEGVLWLTSLAIDEQLALGDDIVPGHDILSGRYACYGTYAGSDGKWLAVGAIEAKFFANLCGALGCPELTASQLDDDAQEKIRAAFVAAFAARTPRRVGAAAGGSGHVRRSRAGDLRGGGVTAVRRPGRRGRGLAPDGGCAVAVGSTARGHGAAAAGSDRVAAGYDADGYGTPLEGGRCGR